MWIGIKDSRSSTYFGNVILKRVSPVCIFGVYISLFLWIKRLNINYSLLQIRCFLQKPLTSDMCSQFFACRCTTFSKQTPTMLKETSANLRNSRKTVIKLVKMLEFIFSSVVNLWANDENRMHSFAWWYKITENKRTS